MEFIKNALIDLFSRNPLSLAFALPIKFLRNHDELLKNPLKDGFVKSFPATGGTKRAKIKECGPLGAVTSKLPGNAADGLFTRPSNHAPPSGFPVKVGFKKGIKKSGITPMTMVAKKNVG